MPSNIAQSTPVEVPQPTTSDMSPFIPSNMPNSSSSDVSHSPSTGMSRTASPFSSPSTVNSDHENGIPVHPSGPESSGSHQPVGKRLIETFLIKAKSRLNYTKGIPFANQIATEYALKRRSNICRKAARRAKGSAASSDFVNRYLLSLPQFNFQGEKHPLGLAHLNEVLRVLKFPTSPITLACKTEQEAIARGNRNLYTYMVKLLEAADSVGGEDPAVLSAYILQMSRGKELDKQAFEFLHLVDDSMFLDGDVKDVYRLGPPCHHEFLKILLGGRLAGEEHNGQNDNELGRLADAWAHEWARVTQKAK